MCCVKYEREKLFIFFPLWSMAKSQNKNIKISGWIGLEQIVIWFDLKVKDFDFGFFQVIREREREKP